MSVDSPTRTLEKRLRHAIISSLHDLVPEFRAHVPSCAHCNSFHDWVLWQHREGTTEWYAECPNTGSPLVLPFQLGAEADTDQR
jgi:hypothetical protein